MNRINYLCKQVKDDLNKNDKVAAAITLRSLLEETVNRISLSYPEKCDNLYDKINYLHQKKYIDTETKELFNNIRQNGNLAAHSKPGVCSVKELKNYDKKLEKYLEANLKGNKIDVKQHKFHIPSDRTLKIIWLFLNAVILAIYIYFLVNGINPFN